MFGVCGKLFEKQNVEIKKPASMTEAGFTLRMKRFTQ